MSSSSSSTWPSSPASSLLIIILFLSRCSLNPIEAIVVRVPSGKVKCVTEDVDPTAMSFLTYRIAAGDNITARVTDPNGETIHLANDVGSGQFVFVAKQPGRHSACFWSPLFKLGGGVEVDFEWKTGIAGTAERFRQVAKKGKVNAVETDLKKLEDSVNSIYTEMRILRQREEESWKLNQDTNSRMGVLSLLSLAICLSVAGLQIWHLKTFFEREKIL